MRVVHFIHQMSCDSEPLDLAALFNPADATNTIKASWPWHGTKSWQNKFKLHLDADRGSLGCQHEHSALSNIQTVSGVVMVFAVGPVEQQRQRYLKPPRISSLNRLIHIRTRIPFVCSPCAHHSDHGKARQEGDRFLKVGPRFTVGVG